ncbi:hypothetical protein CRV08_06220 [Halarcobacter ebronensis]|uniref:Histidine kinase n=1 Tax=Halarcobacter ebronensis TaxID=1462615 RepID=A0A4Q0YH39_9BACT|nr:PAS domain-containing sensor histidine kinase [Halarcobacter ebronensis]RXJ69024.1 hypothetical protein CRV08_06220 [Halarcobacter ebronensis]
MSIKRYINVYTLLAIFSILLIIIGIRDIENRKKEHILTKYYFETTQKYKDYLNGVEEYSDIYFFNHIYKNSELIALLKSEDKDRFTKIDKLLKDSYGFFKNYYIKGISLYEKDYNLIFSSFGKYEIIPTHKEFLDNYLQEKNSQITLASYGIHLNFLKPVFDDKYNLLAIFESSIDLPKYLHNLSLKQELSTQLIFSKNILDSLNKKAFENYQEYNLDSNYVYEKSFYSSRVDNLNLSLNKNDLKRGFSSNRIFSVFYENQDLEYIKIFLPIIDTKSNNKLGYFVVDRKADEYAHLSFKYDLISLMIALLAILISYFIYLYNLKKSKCLIVQRKLQEITKSIDKYVIIAETDLQGIITYASEAFCKISGYKKSEIIGRPISIIRNPDISKNFFEKMWYKISKGDIWEGEVKNLDKNGNSYWERGNITPIYNDESEVIGYRAIKVNITDEKQLQKVNSLLKKELFLRLNEIKTMDKLKVDESKIKLMSRILDTFSNEWKKPISNINASLLDFDSRVDRAKYTKKDLKDFIFLLKDEIRLLSKNLNEFRKLFIEDEDNDKFNVYGLINSVLESVSSKEVQISLVGSKEIEIYGIYHDLKKVIFGIITNSLDAFHSKNISNGKIQITLSEENKKVLIKIKDNAGGVEKEILPKIFDYNFSTKYYTKVDGLPLYLAKLIIEKSNGKIWAENEDDGCSFFIELDINEREKESKRVL